MSKNINIRPVYFTVESWNIEQKIHSDKCKFHKLVNSKYFILNNKKEIKIKKKKKLNKCSICWDTIYILDKWTRLSMGLSVVSKNNNIRTLICNHKFHNTCINKWLDSHNTCPLCRREV